jgi:hypothetical protein
MKPGNARFFFGYNSGVLNLLRSKNSLSLLSLVLVNLAPIIGVIWFDWDVAALVVLYWSENLVLGFYTICKMLLVSPVGGVFSSAFFLVHFGGFCAVHGLFILILLVDDNLSFMEGGSWPFFLVFVQLLVEVVRMVLSYAPPAWLLAFIALYISHGISFYRNFVLGGERETATINKLMGEPYARIVVLHITIIFGGMAIMALGESLALLTLLVLLKLGMDIVLHRREHRLYAERAAALQVAAHG